MHNYRILIRNLRVTQTKKAMTKLNKRQLKLLTESIEAAKMLRASVMNDASVSDDLKFCIKTHCDIWILGRLESLQKEVCPTKRATDDTNFGVSED